MNKFYRLLAFVLIVAAFTTPTFAQDTNEDSHQLTVEIPNVALLDIESAGSTTITLTAEAPTEAGLPLDFTNATDNSLWLNYSSIIGAANRKVTVSAAGDLPSGADIRVKAGNPTGSGNGTLGAGVGFVTVTDSDADVITGVGSSYTGDGAASGHNLTYKLVIDNANYGNLNFDDTYSMTVTYTLVDM